MTTPTEAVEILAERRRYRNKNFAGLRAYNPEELTPAEEAARRLAQADADRALVERELAARDERAAKFAKEQKAAGPRLAKAADAYLACNEPEFHKLVADLEALVIARRNYQEAFSIADKYAAIPENFQHIQPRTYADWVHRIAQLAASA